MNVRDLHDQEHDGQEPPSTDTLAGEYVLGVLDAEQRRQAQARIQNDPGFARLVAEWEARLAPWLDDLGHADVPAHLWPRIRRQLGWAVAESAGADGIGGLWRSAGFWRGMTGLAAAVALAVWISVRLPTAPAPVPPVAVQPPASEEQAAKPVTTLAHDDGTPGWLASVDPQRGTVLMVPVPAPADAQGRVPELWLIPPGESAKSLGIVSIDKSHTVSVPAALRQALTAGAVLAITLEPPGGAPQGVATGPIIAKGDIAHM